MSPREHLMASAERELAAFMRAVSEIFGAEHARQAADDWLDEFERMDRLPEIRSHFGSVTIAAAACLAASLNTGGHSVALSARGGVDMTWHCVVTSFTYPA